MHRMCRPQALPVRSYSFHLGTGSGSNANVRGSVPTFPGSPPPTETLEVFTPDRDTSLPSTLYLVLPGLLYLVLPDPQYLVQRR
ncbi:hypothetical protein NHX12_012035 [Muraenolepis orangiensis]|uniref:Uncharacterized protein n=1 Tax=Muraenolepis orangiensis TaxID=630683 RepID=A0A9Q0DHL6_9TELE|nr:hypothetical protein NHX12_012035 [Muraenolepis orangiensis]